MEREAPRWPPVQSWLSLGRLGSESVDSALSELVSADGVRSPAAIADLSWRCVLLALQIAADDVGDDLGGIQERQRVPVESGSDGVGRLHVSADGVPDDPEPGTLPTLHHQVPIDDVVLDRKDKAVLERWVVDHGDVAAAVDGDVPVDSCEVQVDGQRLVG